MYIADAFCFTFRYVSIGMEERHLRRVQRKILKDLFSLYLLVIIKTCYFMSSVSCFVSHTVKHDLFNNLIIIIITVTDK